MEQEISDLLERLDISTLKTLPCFFDAPRNIEDINFRIGLSEGPQIKFGKVTNDAFGLSIRDLNGIVFTYPIQLGSSEFRSCQEIRNRIITITNDEYRAIVQENIEILLGNLVRQIEPIFNSLEDYNG